MNTRNPNARIPEREASGGGEATGRGLGQGGRGRRHVSHFLPVGDPGPHMVRALDPERSHRATAAPKATPQKRVGLERREDILEVLQLRDKTCLRHRNAMMVESNRELVLVSASRDHGQAQEEDRATQSVACGRESEDGSVRGRDYEIDRFGGPQGEYLADEVAVLRIDDEMVSDRCRFRDDEAVVVTTHDHQRGIPGGQTADEVVARPGSRCGQQYPGRHR